MSYAAAVPVTSCQPLKESKVEKQILAYTLLRTVNFGLRLVVLNFSGFRSQLFLICF